MESVRVSDAMRASAGKALGEQPTVRQNVLIRLLSADGQEKARRELHNTMPSAAKEAIIDQLLASPTYVKPGWMEVGTGSGGTTKLNAYIAGSRTALDSKTRSGAVVTMVCTFGAGVGTGAITEAGVFSVVTEDTVDSTHPMYAYSSFSVINKAAGDSLIITWTLTES